MSPIQVSITGFTGRIGRLLTTELLNDSNIVIHGICRDQSKLPPEVLSHPNVKVFTAQVGDTETIRAAVRGSSICVCCYMGDDSVLIDGQKTLIDACIAEGVSRYVASDWSFDHRGFKLDDIPFKNFQKHIANYLEERKDQINAVHILNGCFMEIFWSAFLQVYNPEERVLKTWGSGDEKIDLTSWVDAAKFTADVVKDPKAVGWIRVLGDRVSAKEISSAYENAYGHPLRLQNEGSLKDMHETLAERRKTEPENPFAWFGLVLYYFMLNGATSLDGLDNSRFSTKPQNLRQFMSENTEESLAPLMEKKY